MKINNQYNLKKTLQFTGALLCSVALAGCNTTPTRPNTEQNAEPVQLQPKDLTPFKNYEISSQHYQAWEKARLNTQPLKLAHAHAKQAYKLRPYNNAIQHLYYTALVSMGYTFDELKEEELKTVYEQLQPEVKQEVPAPAKSIYARYFRQKKSAETLLPVLYRAVKQKPYDSHTWQQLSERFNDTKQYNLAIASADIANKIEPNTYYGNMALAEAYNNRIESVNCFYQDKAATKKAATYAAKAAKISENPYVNGFVGIQYLRLGLYPLAHPFVAKAHEANPEKWSTELIVDTLLNLRRYEQAIEAAKKQKGRNKQFVKISQMMLAADSGQWAKAKELYAQTYTFPTLYNSLINSWIGSLASQKTESINPGIHILAKTKWQKSVADFITKENPESINALTGLATNVCEKVDAHFYTAFRYWREGNIEATKKHLKLTRKQGVPRYKEHILAGILLKHL